MILSTTDEVLTQSSILRLHHPTKGQRRRYLLPEILHSARYQCQYVQIVLANRTVTYDYNAGELIPLRTYRIDPELRKLVISVEIVRQEYREYLVWKKQEQAGNRHQTEFEEDGDRTDADLSDKIIWLYQVLGKENVNDLMEYGQLDEDEESLPGSNQALPFDSFIELWQEFSAGKDDSYDKIIDYLMVNPVSLVDIFVRDIMARKRKNRIQLPKPVPLLLKDLAFHGLVYKQKSDLFGYTLYLLSSELFEITAVPKRDQIMVYSAMYNLSASSLTSSSALEFLGIAAKMSLDILKTQGLEALEIMGLDIIGEYLEHYGFDVEIKERIENLLDTISDMKDQISFDIKYGLGKIWFLYTNQYGTYNTENLETLLRIPREMVSLIYEVRTGIYFQNRSKLSQLLKIIQEQVGELPDDHRYHASTLFLEIKGSLGYFSRIVEILHDNEIERILKDLGKVHSDLDQEDIRVSTNVQPILEKTILKLVIDYLDTIPAQDIFDSIHQIISPNLDQTFISPKSVMISLIEAYLRGAELATVEQSYLELLEMNSLEKNFGAEEIKHLWQEILTRDHIELDRPKIKLMTTDTGSEVLWGQDQNIKRLAIANPSVSEDIPTRSFETFQNILSRSESPSVGELLDMKPEYQLLDKGQLAEMRTDNPAIRDHISYHLQLAQAYSRTGQIDRALSTINEGLQLAKELPTILDGYWSSLYRAKITYKEALDLPVKREKLLLYQINHGSMKDRSRRIHQTEPVLERITERLDLETFYYAILFYLTRLNQLDHSYLVDMPDNLIRLWHLDDRDNIKLKEWMSLYQKLNHHERDALDMFDLLYIEIDITPALGTRSFQLQLTSKMKHPRERIQVAMRCLRGGDPLFAAWSLIILAEELYQANHLDLVDQLQDIIAMELKHQDTGNRGSNKLHKRFEDLLEKTQKRELKKANTTIDDIIVAQIEELVDHYQAEISDDLFDTFLDG